MKILKRDILAALYFAMILIIGYTLVSAVPCTRDSFAKHHPEMCGVNDE